ncbi:MAG: hypothetical protein ACTSR3_01350 [Candidatus Helarchaeota archaeon]
MVWLDELEKRISSVKKDINDAERIIGSEIAERKSIIATIGKRYAKYLNIVLNDENRKTIDYLIVGAGLNRKNGYFANIQDGDQIIIGYNESPKFRLYYNQRSEWGDRNQLTALPTSRIFGIKKKKKN